jgi:glycosyltransferase involved in cell wall biosynthesis
VSEQDYQEDIECIIIDDCGQDDSLNLVEDYLQCYKGPIQFRIIRHEHNRGLAAARNTGVENANGDFIMHLDSDDWLATNAVSLLVRKQIDTEADIVSGAAIAHYVGYDKNLLEPDYKKPLDMVHNTIKMTLDHVLWRRLIRKSLYTDNHIKAIEGVNIGEDHHTLPRLAFFAKKIAKIDNVVYHYNCMNQNSYMGSSQNRLSIQRYFNDKQSIGILKEFFLDKDISISDELNAIERDFFKRMRRLAISLNDKENYMIICRDQNKIPLYMLWRTKYRVLKFIKGQ